MTKPMLAALGAVGGGALSYWPDSFYWTDDFKDARDKGCAVLVKAGVDPEAFVEWFAEVFGQHHAMREAHGARAQRAAVVRWLRGAERAVRAGSDRKQLQQMPDLADAAVHQAAHRSGGDWEAVLRGGDANRIAAVLHDALVTLTRQRARRGQPSTEARDTIFAAVRDRLGIKDRDMADYVAREMLTCFNLPLPPEDPESVERLKRMRRSAGQYFP